MSSEVCLIEYDVLADEGVSSHVEGGAPGRAGRRMWRCGRARGRTARDGGRGRQGWPPPCGQGRRVRAFRPRPGSRCAPPLAERLINVMELIPSYTRAREALATVRSKRLHPGSGSLRSLDNDPILTESRFRYRSKSGTAMTARASARAPPTTNTIGANLGQQDGFGCRQIAPPRFREGPMRPLRRLRASKGRPAAGPSRNGNT